MKRASWLAGSPLYAGNHDYLAALADAFATDPAALSEEWRAWFEAVNRYSDESPASSLLQSPAPADIGASRDSGQVHVLRLIDAHRFSGVRAARLDPLERVPVPHIPELTAGYYGFTDADLATEFDTGFLCGPQRLPLADILARLRGTYCGTLAFEYSHITDLGRKRWLQERIEGCAGTAALSIEDRRAILRQLTAAETLERFLHVRYVGQKRFSLEGAESLIPLLTEVIHGATRNGAREVIVGMAHRGRLNVLVNVLGKSPADLFSEFEGRTDNGAENGDVKYHQGFSAELATPSGPVHVALAFNPSHLEIVHPVVRGSVRARQQKRGDREGRQVVPVIIHGDASLSGQGVVMETLNMSQTRGFRNGGALHVVVNNQIGFTTSDPRDARSSLYCTDVAKMVEAPIIHVNADDADAVVLAARIALDYRREFRRNVFIDLVCYRRHGHNEQDEPAVTQPLMYSRIRKHPPARSLYAERLLHDGVVTAGEAEAMIADYRARLEAGEAMVELADTRYRQDFATDWKRFRGIDWRAGADTRVGAATLADLGRKLAALPVGFTAHAQVEKLLATRRDMVEGRRPVDWGCAETLGYASLLVAGHGVRLSGQDSGRGTFFHRHAVLHDQKRERWDAGEYVPLQHLAPDQAHFLVIDSLLSEAAVLAFEYGYATAQPDELVIWEAQYGDFANGAQVVVDQFVASGEAKWGRLCGLVMMLPHGQEGQGPEHSSARIERFLELAAGDNLQLVQPTTAAQMFHLLRRQLLRPYRKPLVIFSPKSLLRDARSFSALDELAAGAFQPVIGEGSPPEQVRRVVLCTGKVYYALADARRERGRDDVAILRLEQIHPFPDRELGAWLARFAHAGEMVWAQEEPGNQGAWPGIDRRLAELAGMRSLRYAGPPAAAAPAVGYAWRFEAQQRALIETVFAWYSGNVDEVDGFL